MVIVIASAVPTLSSAGDRKLHSEAAKLAELNFECDAGVMSMIWPEGCNN